MMNDDMELVRGSGNVYRDFGYPDADVRQLKSWRKSLFLRVIKCRVAVLALLVIDIDIGFGKSVGIGREIGAVLYTGATVVPFSANLHGIPINQVWSA